MFRGLELLSCEDRLREMRLFSIGSRRLQGNLVVAFQYINKGYKKEGVTCCVGR